MVELLQLPKQRMMKAKTSNEVTEDQRERMKLEIHLSSNIGKNFIIN